MRYHEGFKGRRWDAAGQVVMEYLILLTAIALLTLLSLTQFDDDIRRALEQAFRSTAGRIANP